MALKRSFDILLSLFFIIILGPLMILIALIIKLGDRGPAVYWSKRIGINSEIFLMPKFRTMKIDTPQLATHLLKEGKNHLTPSGGILRKLSLDEFPQLYSILRGEMSFVGPRPALFNQKDLIDLRKEKGIDKILPGLTGWAQINGRDEIPIVKKVEFDFEYLKRANFLFDIKIIILTFIKVMKSEDINH